MQLLDSFRLGGSSSAADGCAASRSMTTYAKIGGVTSGSRKRCYCHWGFHWHAFASCNGVIGLTTVVPVPENFDPLQKFKIVSLKETLKTCSKSESDNLLHFAFHQLLNGNWLEGKVMTVSRHEGLFLVRTYPVYFLCLEDVLHDLEIGDELVFVFCIHLDTIHWYIA